MALVELREILTEGIGAPCWGCGADRVRTRT
jgi:hypothetical protein